MACVNMYALVVNILRILEALGTCSQNKHGIHFGKRTFAAVKAFGSTRTTGADASISPRKVDTHSTAREVAQVAPSMGRVRQTLIYICKIKQRVFTHAYVVCLYVYVLGCAYVYECMLGVLCTFTQFTN